MAKVKHADPEGVLAVPVTQRALVVGGGIAGMSAALAVADHGFEVDLVESNDRLGGNLLWLQRTLEGHPPDQLLQETLERVQKQPNITVHTCCRVASSRGQVGNFKTRIEIDADQDQTIAHGVTILATGGREAATREYAYGQSKAIVTQKQLEEQLAAGTLDPDRLTSVAMIQCVGSREVPRNYCSRVCCGAALKNGFYLREHNPDLAVYILYRDIMTDGFTESYYTQARKAGMVFIPYTPSSKPKIDPGPAQAAGDGDGSGTGTPPGNPGRSGGVGHRPVIPVGPPIWPQSSAPSWT